ncbi:hypothetical protein [Terrabacter sp. 2RAF25]|uniref:hypothetical protein n=1 Tax=Terrabacter sp. 2RAF25 TaxID=3232998 RepID=UPI003F97A5B0
MGTPEEAEPPVLAGLLCRLAAAALPRASRQRYLAEWRADLTDLAADSGQPFAYAWSILLHAVELRRVLAHAGASMSRPLRCRLHLHDFVAVHDSPEDRRYVSRHCRRCGYIKDDGRGASQPPDGLVWGASMGIH